ncbi:4-hydroxybenzoate solanesyltransferase [Nodosilinea sp. E11]|uniref:4-hydroxybenzoate solanesyltransferase n=1 Tax=Nodosilinea sp. E11 TaxID=3037479 RepID=UPI002934E1EA|nr:4-hydroxybenzoate solanesyltransferase [Nodosilinea sp. E11]WOD37837.1 4-hydroxybenzoate solanesyltransferase [Nodosilinea sp. E11]
MASPSTRPRPSLFDAIIRLLRWDKPAGRLILMIPALWSVVLAAEGQPPLPLVGVIILGTLATSAAGCVVNDLWDRNIDPHVARTRTRPLAARDLTVQVGLGVLLVSLLCAYGLSLYLNALSFWLCVLAVPFILFYPLAKRVFPVPQLVLSLAWGFAVLIPWAAVKSTLELPVWILWLAVVLWTLGFDTVYAIPDRDDDRRLGVNSAALYFGDYTPQFVGFCYLGTWLLFIWLGLLLFLALPYWLGLAIALMAWSRQSYLLSRYNPPLSLYGQVFRQNVQLGFGLLVGMILGMLL